MTTTALALAEPPDLTIQLRDGYLLATLVGAISFTRVKQILAEVKTQADGHGVTRVVVDARRKMPLTDVYQRFDVAHWLSHHWSTKFKLAIVSAIPLHQRDYLTEGVMRNHRHVVNSFNTEEEAVRWVMHDTDRVVVNQLSVGPPMSSR